MRVSIVVPTKDRPEEVSRLLRALARQNAIDGEFEVIVVADGCTDATVRRLRAAAWPFPCHVLEQPSAGPASARNCGAALASGSLLLFLDDDVEPEPGVIAAHVALHEIQPRAIGVGYLPPAVEDPGFFGAALRGWWESMQDGPRRPWHRYTYKNLLSGHFSIQAEDFERLGGFDATLRCHEDYEFGYRAIEAGVHLQFVPGAAARHCDTSDLHKALARKFEEGRADVRLAERYPELIPSLPIVFPPPGSRVARLLLACAWRRRWLGDLIASRIVAALPLYERARLRYRWRARLGALLLYRYWRGVAAEAGTRERLQAIVSRAPAPAPPEITIDLLGGFERAEAILDARRPRSARLILGGHDVGDIPAAPGAERLRGAHLRRLVARDLARRYMAAAAAEGVLPPFIDRPREVRAA
jgi:glycosyltransferase involved in cell wall biosynthesis